MKDAVMVTFALPAESGCFLRQLKKRQKLVGGALPQYVGWIGEQCVRVVHTGAGEESAGRILCALNARDVRRVVSARFAGGLLPGLVVGELFVAENFSSYAVEVEGSRRGEMVTVESPAETVEEKRGLREMSGADAVDMETQVIAKWAGEKGVPVLSLRVISDAADGELPVPFAAWFDAGKQRVDVRGLLGFLARHPGRIPAFLAFVADTRKASRRLAEALVEVVGGR